MLRSRLMVLFFILMTSFNAGATVPSLDKKLVIVTWANDGGLWTDQLVMKFKQHLEFTGIQADTVILTWSVGKPKDFLIKTVEFLNPDLIYFPQEHLYLFLAKELADAGKKAHFLVNNVEFAHDKLNLLASSRQTVISSYHDFDYLFEKVKSLGKGKKTIKKIGLLAPFFHKDLILQIRKSASKHGMSLEQYHTNEWSEYVKKFREFEKNCDAIFPLPPFEIFQNGKRISMHNFRSLINGSEIITMGYRKLGNIRRTIDFNIAPSDFGKMSAYEAYDYLKGKKTRNRFVSTKSFVYNFEHIRSLNLEIPTDRSAYFAAPGYRR